MEITPYLKLMVERGASDMFFSIGARPNIKIEAKTLAVGKHTLDSAALRAMSASLLDAEQKRVFEETLELNLGFTLPGVGRFRANLYHQRGEIAMVVRHIKDTVPSMAELGLPAMLEELILEKRGLILVVGATGCGKSTTLGSMIDYRNSDATGHILTIEDPIEFVHDHKLSVVDQREVGIDTLSYSHALKSALREAPDVTMIGEIRDAETMEHAVHFAETGHLCLATLAREQRGPGHRADRGLLPRGQAPPPAPGSLAAPAGDRLPAAHPGSGRQARRRDRADAEEALHRGPHREG